MYSKENREAALNGGLYCDDGVERDFDRSEGGSAAPPITPHSQDTVSDVMSFRNSVSTPGKYYGNI